MKVVIDRTYGCSGLSEEAADLICERKGKPYFEACYPGCQREDLDLTPEIRTDSDLIYAVETLGKNASAANSELQIIEVPAGVKWHIDEYDGKEWIAENHRTWGKE